MRYHRDILCSLLRDAYGNNPMEGAEIGVACGHTSVRLLEEFPDLFLYLIDPYNYQRIYREKWAEEIKQAETVSKEQLAPFSDRTQWIRKDSRVASSRFNHESLDWVFIDANHTYENVLRDIRHWHPRVKPGGLVMGHDYGTRHDRKFRFGVKPAVDWWTEVQGIDLKLGGCSIWYYYK